MDSLLRDTMFVFRGEIKQDGNVVIIDIDNKSLAVVGHWPWSRDTVAKLVDTLDEAGAGLIGLDIIFAEADNTSPSRVLKKIGMDTTNIIDYDELLAQTLASTPTILGYQFALEEDEYSQKGFPLVPAIFIKQNHNEDLDDYITKGYGTLLNIPILQENSYSSGFVNNVSSSSGIVRTIPLVVHYDGAIYPSLSLEIIRAISGERIVHLDYSNIGIKQIRVGAYSIPTNVAGHAFINFRGQKKTFQYISAIDILNNTFNKEDIDGKIILVGTSASGLLDLRATPFDSAFPGVEVHASLIDNILVGDFISIPQLGDMYNILHIISITFLTLFGMAFVPVYVVVLLLLTYLLGDLYFLYTMLFSEGMILNIFVPLFTLVVSSVSVILIKNIFISKSEKKIKAKVRQIEKAKEQIESILSSILMPILIIAKKTRTILYANEYASKQYGMQMNNLKGISIDDIYQDEQLDKKIDSLLHSDGLVENIEQDFITKSDKKFTALLSVVPLDFGNEEANISMVTDITKQKKIEKEIRRLHNNTKESIKYASLIQGALIPDNTILENYCDEYFVIWRPRDIVGGDIYLIEALNENELLIMVIDGAGHGVPGAFVTMLVKAISTQILADIKSALIPPSPNIILEYFNKGIKTMLKQEKGSRSNTGFDGGVLYYNKLENRCLYSGAKTDLYVVEDDKLEIIQGDRKNVGFVRTKFNQQYTNHAFEIRQETRLYLATDGIVDQEGENDTRFDDELFETIIINNNLKDFNTQKAIINDTFDDFKQDLEQSDDITIVGIKLKNTNKG